MNSKYSKILAYYEGKKEELVRILQSSTVVETCLKLNCSSPLVTKLRKNFNIVVKHKNPTSFLTEEQIKTRQEKSLKTRIARYGNAFGPALAWNKGLTKETDERVAKNGRGTSRGKKGKALSEEHKQHLSEACIKSEEVQNHILKLNKEFHVGRKRSAETCKNLSDSSFLKGRTLEEAFGIEEANRLKNLSRKGRMSQIFPKKATSIEKKIWAELEARNLIFEKNKSLLGHTQPDAFIEPNICIYADGCYFHFCLVHKQGNFDKDGNLRTTPHAIVNSQRPQSDKNTNEELHKTGYKVFRFWEHDIKKDVSACVDQIEAFINE
jgi:DNA mismatch endonuclease, patch repair protein